mmetsp:Transcript_10992/g.16192  ORF Transcript_10992/g.16192 Transcript_10992/m.16192 type:complete len:1021 (-) Transcript_10992:273-3335(-)
MRDLFYHLFLVISTSLSIYSVVATDARANGIGRHGSCPSSLFVTTRRQYETAFCNVLSSHSFQRQRQQQGGVAAYTLPIHTSKIGTKLSLLPRKNDDGGGAGFIITPHCKRQNQKRQIIEMMMTALEIPAETTTEAEDNSNGDANDIPYSDTEALNAALLELAKSRRPGSAQKAQTILDAAERWYQNNQQNIKQEKEEEDNDSSSDHKVGGPIPDIRSYTHVIDAWSRQGGVKATQNAQKLLDSLIEISNHEQKGGVKKVKKKKNVRRMKPNTIAYNLVIHAWAKSGKSDATDYAEKLLNQMQQHYSDGTNPHCQPNSTTYNAVMNAWAKSALMKNREESNEKSILTNCAGEHAERLLGEMWDQYESTSDPNLRPTQFSYATATSAWARTAAHVHGSESRKCAKRAEDLLEKMEKLAQTHGWADLHPTTYCVNAVMNAWAKTRSKGRVLGAKRAQQILERMVRLYDSGHGRQEVRPNVVSFNTVIDAWAKSGEPRSERHAESILRRMDELSSNPDTRHHYEDCRPDTISYNAVVHAWGRSRDPSAARRAEAILRRMEQRYEENIKKGVDRNNIITPDVTTYTSVINAWARSREKDAASRAESVLKRMEKASSSSLSAKEKNSKSANFAARPTVLSYNTVLNAWAKSSYPEAADRALSLLKQLEDGKRGVRPDVFTYTSAIDALAKSGTKKSAEKAEEILEKMEALYNETGDDKVRPNVRTYTSVIHALSRGKCDPRRAQSILDRMEQLSAEESSLRPDVVSFNAVINAWGWSDTAHKARRAREIYLRMKELHESGANKDARPDLITCNSILNACAYTTGKIETENDSGWDNENNNDGGAQERAEALDIAVQTLEEFQSVSPKLGRPNHITYGTMIMAITNLMTPTQSSTADNTAKEGSEDKNRENGEDISNDVSCLRTDLAIATFWQCCREGQVSPFVISQLRNVVSEATFCEMLGDAAVPRGNRGHGEATDHKQSESGVEKEHKYCCDMKKLPEEWTTFSRGKKSRPSRKKYSEQVSKR